MIARIWRGATLAEKADAYLDYLEATGLPAYRSTPGNTGVQVLHRIDVEKDLGVEHYEVVRLYQDPPGPK